jgi:hypothetical protein
MQSTNDVSELKQILSETNFEYNNSIPSIRFQLFFTEVSL